MPRTATNDKGDVVIFNEQTGAWDPARTASNDKGEKVYFDGDGWQPLTSSAPSAREGAPPGGRAAAPAPAARSSPSPAGASFDYMAPLQAMGEDVLTTARHGQGMMAEGGQNFAKGFGGDFEAMGLGAMQMPAGAIQYLGSPFAPLFRGQSDVNRGGIGKGVAELTGSEYIGNLAADTLTAGEGAMIFGGGPRPSGMGPVVRGDPRARGQIGPGEMKDVTPTPGGQPMPPGGGRGLMERPIEGEIIPGSRVEGGRRIWQMDPAAEEAMRRGISDDLIRQSEEASQRPPTNEMFRDSMRGTGANENAWPYDGPPVTGMRATQGNVTELRPGDMPPPSPPDATPAAPQQSAIPSAPPAIPPIGPVPLPQTGAAGPPQQPPTGAAPPAGPTGPAGTPPAGGPPGNPPSAYVPPPTLMQHLRDGAKTIEKIVSPTTVDTHSRDAEASIRREVGLGRRDTEIARAALDDFNAQVRGMNGTQRRDLIRYIEGRSQGVPLSNSAWQPLADTMRSAFAQREMKLSQLPSTSQMSFVEDYFPHIWKDPRAAQQFAATRAAAPQTGSRQGRGGFVKERIIPTVEDGLAHGLVPQTLNPVEAAMAYIANADRFIAINQVFDDARAAGTIKFRYPGRQQQGEAELHGRLATRPDPNGVPMKAYAPEGWARVFNNFVDPGFVGPTGDVMNAAMQSSNWVTGLELSLSGFHMVTMANEAMISGMARGIRELLTGHPIEAGKALAGSAIAPVRTAMRGHALQQVYKGKRTGTPLQQQIAALIAEAGGLAVKMDRGWLASRQGSYITAFKRGALQEELANDVRDIRHRPVTGTAAVAARNIARTMDTAMSWMFEHYIPKLKVGAFEEHMAAWLRRNPNAPPDVVLKAARDLWDSTDNRFGEMVRDNIFWKNTLKQASQLALRSYSWTFGAGREIAGGLWDTAKAPFTGKWTNRMEYVIALPIMYGIWAAIYQYMKTGEAPKDEQDLLAPRTGGKDFSTGQPERVVPPGFMKDVFGWANKGIVGELWAKTATLPRTAIELATNKDWRGLPIAQGSHADDPEAPHWLTSYLNHVLDNLGPFGVKNVLKGQAQGSNLSAAESLLGFQPAGRHMTDPEGYGRMRRGIERKDWRRRIRADERQERRYKGPSE